MCTGQTQWRLSRLSRLNFLSWWRKYTFCWAFFTMELMLVSQFRYWEMISSCLTQHNAMDVASFEGACNWHADCRNVHQSCCLWIECSFLYHKPSPKAFQRIWQYIQPASQPQTTCNHSSPGPPNPASSPPRLSEASHPESCCNNQFA